MLENFRRWAGVYPAWMLAAVTVAMLLPFLAKPFNIDDPLFIWTAKQIQAHPLDPYGFDVNWYGESQPMWSVTENPPLASYYLAVAAKGMGWSETALHAAFMLPAILVVLGTWRLAKRFCQNAMMAAMMALLTPVFMVSGMTVMCDVLMLAFWVWAVVFWAEGTEQNHYGKLFAAASLIAFAAVTKYFGACLIPLLGFYTCVTRRRFSVELAFLLVPLACLCLYQWTTRLLYGHALLSEAVNYVSVTQKFLGISKVDSMLTALAFSGGCMAVATFLGPLLWRGRVIAGFALAAVAATAGIIAGGLFSKHYPWIQGADEMRLGLQMAIWVFGGISILALAVADLWRRRDAISWLLCLWVFGTFIFTAVFNWTVNARSILPMVPAVAILLARRLETLPAKKIRFGVPFCVAAGGLLTLWVTRADFLFAVAVRQTAQAAVAKYSSQPGRLWSHGHWGFQFYMTQGGATQLDIKHAGLKGGDYLVMPENTENSILLDPDKTTEVETIYAPGPEMVTTLGRRTGAGFYAASFAPLPFAFGRVPPEKATVYVLRPVPSPKNGTGR